MEYNIEVAFYFDNGLVDMAAAGTLRAILSREDFDQSLVKTADTIERLTDEYVASLGITGFFDLTYSPNWNKFLVHVSTFFAPIINA